MLLQIIIARSSEYALCRRLAFRIVVLTIILQCGLQVTSQAVVEVEINVSVVQFLQAQRFSIGDWWSVRLLQSVLRCHYMASERYLHTAVDVTKADGGPKSIVIGSPWTRAGNNRAENMVLARRNDIMIKKRRVKRLDGAMLDLRQVDERSTFHILISGALIYPLSKVKRNPIESVQK